ncbi:MAG: hypothetical protein KDD48_06860 [Bdellovibrionales bacterium]|nr:hypothetical protein [Bdellovibrionales bacterium]
MKISLRLYYTGGSPVSELARVALKALQSRHSSVQFEIEEIDVVLYPDAAEADGILATPTVIKFSPLPIAKIVGDISSLEQVLGLRQSSSK